MRDCTLPCGPLMYSILTGDTPHPLNNMNGINSFPKKVQQCEALYSIPLRHVLNLSVFLVASNITSSPCEKSTSNAASFSPS